MESPPTPAPALRQGVRAGLLWTTASAVARFALQLGVSIVLARLLSPSDFGRAGMVAAFMTVIAPLASASLAQAVIAGRDDSREALSSLFWTSVALGCTASIAFYLCAPLIALYYGDEQLGPIARALSASFALVSLSTVPEGVLRKRMAFSSVSRIEVGIGATSSAVAIACAYKGLGVWSLVAQSLMQSGLAAMLWLLATGFRPLFVLQRSTARAGLRFGGALSLTDIVSFIANSAHTFIIGRTLGAYAMGLYSRAIGISQLLQQHVGMLTGNVMFPVLANMRDVARIKSATLQATAGTALITAPIATGLVVTGDLVVEVLYGAQWQPAVLPLRVLAAALFINISLFPIATLYRTMQRADLLLRVSVPAAVLSVASAAAGSTLGGLDLVAWLQLLCSIIMIVPHVWVAGGLVGIDLRAALGSAGSPVACAASMGLAVWMARTLLPAMPSPVELAISVVLGAAVYGGLAFGLRIAPLRTAISLMRGQNAAPDA